MAVNKLVENVFFFGFLGIVTYIVWEIIQPFINSLALAAIIVTICYPLYEWVCARMPKKNKTLGSLITTFIVVFIVVVPVLLLGSFILREAGTLYSLFSSGTEVSLQSVFNDIEVFIGVLIPGFTFDITNYVQQGANFTASHIATIFTGTASAIFLFFITLISTFYFFRDGKEFTKYLIEISPLPDDQDEKILKRLGRSVRSVTLGKVLIALIQGILTAIGLSIFGFERAILWGVVAAFGALIPAIGTTIVFLPAILYLIVIGSYTAAAGLAVWATFAVGLIDNILGPYLMSRGDTIHPFFILLSVLGGIIFFGPIGFILGPVAFSLFKVLLELYTMHIATHT